MLVCVDHSVYTAFSISMRETFAACKFIMRATFQKVSFASDVTFLKYICTNFVLHCTLAKLDFFYQLNFQSIN